MKPTAKPAHTIIRYRPRDLNCYATWRPVEAMRFRLFENATHEEVTGDNRGGAPWIGSWSCETLAIEGHWQINGRNTWRTIDEAIAATSEGTFPTFEAALVEARKIAEVVIKGRRRRLQEAQWCLDTITTAKPLELPE